MAEGSGEWKSKRRKKDDERRKLLTGEKVEVLFTDEGLTGSWHGGVVISCREFSRLIEFTDLLSDDGCSKLVESISVSAAIDGLSQITQETYRGQIRPAPPHYKLQQCDIRYGLCVDAFLDDAWWEGVIFDHEDGSTERLVFFPDQGDQQMISGDRLRLTQEWNEVSGTWSPRGDWLLLRVLETFEQVDALPVSIREIWYDLRTTAAFCDNIGLWMFGPETLWHSLVSELIQQLFSVILDLPVAGGTPNGSKEVSKDSDDIDTPMKNILCLEDTTDLIGSADIHNGLSDFSSKVKCANMNSSHQATEDEILDASMLADCGRGGRPQSFRIEPNQTHGFCPQALSDFLSEYHRRVGRNPSYSSKRYNVTHEMAKFHLLALGWDFKVNHLGRKYYVSPNGKYYWSFVRACEACNGMRFSDTMNHISASELICNDQGAAETDSIHLPKENKCDDSTSSIVGSSWQHLDIEAVYCPEAITLYAPMEKLKGLNIHKSDLRLKAKKHLVALGWKIEHRRDTMLRVRFLSPDGKYYYSLHKACYHLLKGHPSPTSCHKKNARYRTGNRSRQDPLLSPSSAKNNKPLNNHSNDASELSVTSGKKLLKNTSNCFCKCQKSRKRRASGSLVRECHRPDCSFSYRLSRSCKRSREVVASSPIQQVARTVLSLLIDNNMVLPRQKVRYLRRRDNHVMMEGYITREGIKCKCCKQVYTLTNFEAHAGSTNHRPAANIFLQDGRSLMECQMQMLNEKKPTISTYVRDFRHVRLKSDCSNYLSDGICSVCHDGGKLVLCDHCPSSFHLDCVGLKDVPKGKWFCPSCRCGICGTGEFNPDTEQFTRKTIMYCDQCEREYHVGCLRGLARSKHCPVNWFCNKKCSQIYFYLQRLLGKSTTTKDGLSWTILRSTRENGRDQFDSETVAEHHSKLCVALDVLHECFVSIIEPRTQSDLVADLIFNRESELNRLNFSGFYTMLLERGDELISVATFRVYGEKVAEMPLVGTRVKYRRQGMCRLLVNELEKLLRTLGVEKLVLPAVPQLLKTWTSSFGFTKMGSCDRLDFMEYSLVNFQDTSMCQKLLKSPAGRNRKRAIGHCDQLDRSSGDVDSNKRCIAIASEVVEMVEPIMIVPSLPTVEQIVRSETTDQTYQNVFPDKCKDSSLLVGTPTVAVAKPSSDLGLELLEKCCKQIGKSDTKREHLGRSVIARDVHTFKYFYRRRISAN